VLPLDCGQPFDPAREEECFAALPAHPAVFLIEPKESSAQPYLARTAGLRRRVERLLRAPVEPTRRLNLREFAAGVRYRLTGSAFEQSLVFYQQAREKFPQRYRDLARLRRPVLLKVSLRNEYPRCYVTRRVIGSGFYFGPFPSRKTADSFADEFLNLFKIRRCQIKIRRDPSFPGCIYSEMKMCLAPCFAGCSKQEYDVEVGRVTSFLASAGASLTAEFEQEREAASGALDFERAAAIHKKIEKVGGILRGLPELIRKVDELDAVIVQPSAEEENVAIFAVRGGRIADPLTLRFGELASQPRSVEEILREHLEPQNRDSPQRHAESAEKVPVHAQNPSIESRISNHELSEHLSLLARWFYSKPRVGEMFFREKRWPYRRILRACSRLLAPQSALPFEKEKPGPPMDADKRR
jgi:excinuclease UvrABC nuclease subunit